MVVASVRERSSNESESTPGPVRPGLAIGLLALLAAAAGIGLRSMSGGEGAGEAASPGRAIVDQVIDGDTIDVRLGDTRHRVRLLGIDAPESVAPTVPVQCFGHEASEALRLLLPPGTTVELHRDVESHDHYGRLLAYVHRSDDQLFVNRWLLDEGYADAVSYQPNTTFRSTFSAAARAAERSGRGLWGRCDGPDQPLDPDEVPDGGGSP